ncbi:MAG: AI-2E family transporter [Saprospiraceae bacterium]
MRAQNIAYLLVSCISIVIILIYGQAILVPFILGILLWFIGKQLEATLDKISFIKRKFPIWLKHILSFGIISVILIFITNILTTNINSLAQSFELYEPNLDALLLQIDEWLGVDTKKALKNYSGNLDFGNILQLLFSSISDIISNGFMILLYAVFILLEDTSFKPKLKSIFVGKENEDKVDAILEKISNSISSYFGLKTLLSLITGGLSYIALRIIGVDAPEFWAFLIFILNFIPTIGSLIATIFPAIFCLFQFGIFTPSLLVLGIVGTIQVIVGNFLEPKIMGSSMNISPLVTILSLSIWGALWGVIGMILSVPITVVTIIIFSQFEKTKSVAIMLSEKGEIR